MAAFSNATSLGSRSSSMFASRLQMPKQGSSGGAQLRHMQAAGPGVLVEATMVGPARDTSAAPPQGQALQRQEERMHR